jgi:FkbM family methyltransferase
MNSTAAYSALLRIRPAQACEAVKKIIGVRRRIVRSTGGHCFDVDPVSLLGIALMRDGAHEPALTQLFQFVLDPGDVCVDLGANEGYFSVIAAAAVGPHGAVHCIEPQSRLQEVLRRNFKINELDNVEIHQVAINDDGRPTRLFLRPSTNSGASSLIRHWRVGWSSELIPATTLDKLFADAGIENVKLLKIDCEGAEWSILRGARNVLSRRMIDIIAMMYHPAICGVGKCDEIHATLIQSGYSLIRISGNCIYTLPSAAPDLLKLPDAHPASDWKN